MKKILFSFLLNILIFSFVFSLFIGVRLPKDILYLIGVYSALSVGLMLQRPLLKFLTVKNNLLTYWLSSSIIALGVFYLLISFAPGLTIVDSVIAQTTFGPVTIHQIAMDKMLTMIVSVLLAGLISGIMEGLKKPTEE